MNEKVQDVLKGATEVPGPDGLLVCTKCGKPRQRRLDLPGAPTRIVPVQCACQEAAEKERTAREERKSHAAKLEKARRACFPNGGFYRNCTFSADDGRSPYQSTICARYAETFTKDDPNGLLLWGEVGTGKSFMSAAIANAVIDLGYSALQTDIGSIVSILESSYENRHRELNRILGYDLLCLEDLGAQRCTEYMMGHIYAVIDGRYKTGKPMVITTNFALQAISHVRPDDPWSRIFDRIIERCFPVEFKGTNRRRENGLEMRKAMRERLGI